MYQYWYNIGLLQEINRLTVAKFKFTVNPRISAPLELAPPLNKRPSYRPKFKISVPAPSNKRSPPLPPFCERVMRQQRVYSFCHVVLDLYIVFQFVDTFSEHVEHVKY